MKLIDADELRKKIARERGAWQALDAWVAAIDQALYIVDSMPAAEANQAPGPDWKAKLRKKVEGRMIPQPSDNYATSWNVALGDLLDFIDALPDPPTPDPDAPPVYVPPEGHVASVLGKDVPDGWVGRRGPNHTWWHTSRLRRHPDALFEVRRVPAPEPATEWVPLTKLVGRTIKGEELPVQEIVPPSHGLKSLWRWKDRAGSSVSSVLPVNPDDGLVEVLAEGER